MNRRGNRMPVNAPTKAKIALIASWDRYFESQLGSILCTGYCGYSPTAIPEVSPDINVCSPFGDWLLIWMWRSLLIPGCFSGKIRNWFVCSFIVWLPIRTSPSRIVDTVTLSSSLPVFSSCEKLTSLTSILLLIHWGSTDISELSVFVGSGKSMTNCVGDRTVKSSSFVSVSGRNWKEVSSELSILAWIPSSRISTVPSRIENGCFIES